MREQEVSFEQDRLGNENRKLDELRAQGGKVGGGTEGLREIGSADTGTNLIVYSETTDVDKAIILQLAMHNSGPSGGNTLHLLEGDVDSGNPGQLSNTTRRSVDYEVVSGNTRIVEYYGKPFSRSIGFSSEFAGQVAVGVIEDRNEAVESASENTGTP